MTKVLFVCLGNICRSCAAETILQHLVAEKGLADSFEIDSAGLIAYHEGEHADPRMLRHAARHGLVITHRSRPITSRDFQYFDIIVGMDSSNIAGLQRLAPPSAQGKIHLMTEYCQQLTATTVPDPYYGDDDDFEDVLALLAASGSAQTTTDALRPLVSRAAAGDALAQLLLGLHYIADSEEQDIAQAVLWLQAAAEAGVADAQYNLGVAYQYGDAGSVDPHEAVQWWRKAAEQGHSQALYNMGWCYLNGYGVPFDPDEGIAYFRRAAAQGNGRAIEYIMDQILAGFPMPLD